MVVDIKNPICEYTDSSLTENECNNLINEINNILDSKDSINKSIRNSNINEFSQIIIPGIATGIGILIATIRKIIKNKYSINVKRIIDQSKELNDIYSKVEYMLKHDKMARFKHRNDIIECDIKDVILMDPQDPRKRYEIAIDDLAYNPEYFMKEIKDIIDYVNTYSRENKDIDFSNMKINLMKIINDNFNENHWYTRCNPIIKTEHFKDIKLEKVIMLYKDSFSVQYNNIAVINQEVTYQMQCLQLLESAYNKMSSEYSKTKEGKQLVEDVFKKLLQNSITSINFNSNIMNTLEEKIKFYIQELEKIYTIIRN